MEIIKSNAELIKLDNPLQMIELAGRTCYKSEDKITETSAIGFVDRMCKSKHTAMLEHGTITFRVDTITPDLPNVLTSIPYIRWIKKGFTHYVTVSVAHLIKYMNADYDNMLEKNSETFNIKLAHNILQTMCVEFYKKYFDRVLVVDHGYKYEHKNVHIVEDILSIPALTLEEWKELATVSMKFTCDRGVSHELVRHRVSVAQESTRYCNYAKTDKFGSMKFIEPADFENWPAEAVELVKKANEFAESTYNALINLGLTPQQSREVLNNGLKTEVVLTMSPNQWEHFLNLRSVGTTGAPHPDMKIVGDIAYDIYNTLVYETSEKIRHRK